MKEKIITKECYFLQDNKRILTVRGPEENIANFINNYNYSYILLKLCKDIIYKKNTDKLNTIDYLNFIKELENVINDHKKKYEEELEITKKL